MKYSFSKLTFFIIAILLAACEGQTNYYKSIANSSSDTVFLKVFSHYGNMLGADTFSIDPGEERMFFQHEQRGGNSYPVSCIEPFDSIVVSISGGKTLIKEILDEKFWLLTIDSRRRGALVDQHCLFSITDDDLQ